MMPCDKPVSDLTFGEAADCAWSTLKGAVVGVVTHPGSATIAEWIVTLLCAIALLYFFSLLFFRR